MNNAASDERPGQGWTFLTNHGHVLLSIARNPEARLRDVAAEVGITERAAQRIVADLVAEGYLTRERVGRRNQYTVHAELQLRHPIEHRKQVSTLLALIQPDDETHRATAAGAHSQ